MTDKYYALTVILEKDIRSDDAKRLIDAIQMIKGVQNVKPLISDALSWMAEQRAKKEYAEKLIEVLK